MRPGIWLTIAALLSPCLLAPLAAPPARAQDPEASSVGRIVGWLDGIGQDGDHFFLSGWACQQRQAKSIAVQLFAAAGNGQGPLVPVLAEKANLYSEGPVNEVCQDREATGHRFLIALPYGENPNSHIAVHGLRVVDGVPNDAIAGSDTKLKPLAGLNLPYPALPRLGGSYRNLTHPGVFTTADELRDLVSRINRPASYSMRRFSQFAAQIKTDLASGIDWDVTYSGGNGGVYQYTFSYEPQDHHDAETRAALTIAPAAKAPAGAAVVASRLALYASLVKAGAALPKVAPSADDAAQLARRILLAWADHGFRQPNGRFLTLASFKHDGHNRPEGDLGLVLGRGVIYSVNAQDLLQSIGSLNADDVRRLNDFHGALFELMRQSENVLFAGVGFPYSQCSRYTNISTNAVVGMLATARLLNDEHKLDATLYGGDPSIPVLVPWTQLFDHVVYGQSDGPMPDCVSNHESGSLASLAQHHDYQSASAAPGEIADRFRNANPGQGIGYPMFTLERLFDSAELLRNAGFDPYAYRGRHQQSIEMALQYYACFAKGAGFGNVVTADNARACANAAQYEGKIVNGVDRMVLVGITRFPANATITALEGAAESAASNGAFSNDPILFGKWRD